MAMAGFNLIRLSVLFQTFAPKYTCKHGPGLAAEECTHEQICQGARQPQVYAYQLDFGDKYTLHNWMDQLGLVCASPNELALLASLVYIGMSVSAVPVSWLADRAGRKTNVQVAQLIELLCLVGVLMTDSLYVFLTLILTLGVVGTSLTTTSFIYMSELLTSKQAKHAANIQFSVNSVGMLAMIFYLDKIGSNCQIITLAGLVMTAVSFMASFFIFESPTWLLESGKTIQAQKTLRDICDFNGTKCDQEVWELSLHQKDSSEVNYSAISYLKHKKINFELFMMCFMYSGCVVCNSITNYYLMQGRGDVYQNLYRMCTVELLAIFISSILGKNYVSDSNQLIAKLALAALGAMSALVVSDDLGAFQPLFILITKLGVYGTITQLRSQPINAFPVLFQTTALGCMTLFSSVSILLIDKYTISMEEPLPMFLIVAFASLAIALQLLTRFQEKSTRKGGQF